MTERRIAEVDEATGPTLDDTLARLRAEDVSVAEFVEAGGLSSFAQLAPTYVVAAIRDGRPVDSDDAQMFFDTHAEAVAVAESLAPYGRIGVFELRPVEVYGC